MGNLSRFLDKYYIINTVIPLSYVPIRYYHRNKELEKIDPYFGIPKEWEIVLMVVIFSITRYWKTSTMDAYVSKVLLYAKTGIAGLYFYMGWAYLGWYLIACCLSLLLFQHPKYDGPEDLIHLNPSSLTRRVIEGENEQKSTWLVYFFADWCESSLHHDAMFADLSLKYQDSAYLKFAKVDLGRYPELAEEYSIDLSSFSMQLPTLVLFSKGRELLRLPNFKEDGTVRRVILEKKGVDAYFNLVKLAEGPAEEKSAKNASKKSKSSSKKKN